MIIACPPQLANTTPKNSKISNPAWKNRVNKVITGFYGQKFLKHFDCNFIRRELVRKLFVKLPKDEFFFYSDLQIMALTYLLALLFSMRPNWKYIDLALFDVENLGREDLFELLYEAATWASVPNLSSKSFGKSYKSDENFESFTIF